MALPLFMLFRKASSRCLKFIIVLKEVVLVKNLSQKIPLKIYKILGANPQIITYNTRYFEEMYGCLVNKLFNYLHSNIINVFNSIDNV